MRILYIVPYTPNQIRVRPYNLIRTLARAGHQVTLATLWENEQEQADLERLGSAGIGVIAHRLSKARAVENSLLALPTRAPLQARYCWQPVLANDLVQLVQREHFHVIHVEHLRGAVYGLHLRRSFAQRGLPLPPIVWDSVDCISHLFAQAAVHSRSLKSRLMTRLELPRTQRYEGWLAQQFAHVLVTSPLDKAALEKLRPSTASPPPISVVPNGVDVDYFKPTETDRKAATLVISGKMSYHANVSMTLHFIKEIMPAIWRERPDVQVWVVGKDPVAEIRQLDPDWSSKRSETELLAATSRIVATGAVTHLSSFLQRATIAVAPVSYGAGIQNKVLEAMACATPVIASSQAVSALMTRAGRDLLVANAPSDFASTVLGLLSDPLKQEMLRKAGRKYVELNHDWNTIVTRIEEIYSAANRLGGFSFGAQTNEKRG